MNLPFTNGWANINTEIKLLASYYRQKIPDSFILRYTNCNGTHHYKPVTPYLEHSVKRVLPQFKIDGNLIFERSLIYVKGSTQTLEPYAQYIYRPYHNENNIYTYDTTLLHTDYSSFFRERAYSGLDRILSQNRMSSGLTTRIYDNALGEYFIASVGQIYYFSHVGTQEKRIRDNNNHHGNLEWVSDTYWKINNHWNLRGSLQYNSHLNSIALGNATLRYSHDSDPLAQLNYRYVMPGYIQEALKIDNVIYQHGISQVGITGCWPITDRWAIVGAYYYNIHAQQSVNQLLGIQYNTCCWGITLGYERKITDWDTNHNMSLYDNKISCNIEIRGLRHEKNLNSIDILRSSILPYQNVF